MSALSSPQKDSSFLNMMSPSSLILLFLLYNAYYLKSLMRLSIVSIVKRGGNCHNSILGYSKKNQFFFQNKKIIIIKAGNVEKANWGIKL